MHLCECLTHFASIFWGFVGLPVMLSVTFTLKNVSAETAGIRETDNILDDLHVYFRHNSRTL